MGEIVPLRRRVTVARPTRGDDLEARVRAVELQLAEVLRLLAARIAEEAAE